MRGSNLGCWDQSRLICLPDHQNSPDILIMQPAVRFLLGSRSIILGTFIVVSVQVFFNETTTTGIAKVQHGDTYDTWAISSKIDYIQGIEYFKIKWPFDLD